MCNHSELSYLGEQQRLYGKPAYSLYNCKICKSTVVSLKPLSLKPVLDSKFQLQPSSWGSLTNLLKELFTSHLSPV